MSAESFSAGSKALSLEEEVCFTCHKYSGLGRFNDFGNRRIFYIIEDIYKKTVHGPLKCKECHEDVKEPPHKDKKEAGCAAECHSVKPPEGEKGPYSHKKIVDNYAKSVHNQTTASDGSPRKYKEDVPKCRFCHDINKQERADMNEACENCHSDNEMMGRNNIIAINSFKDGFHIESIKSGDEKAPDCISCHAPPDFSAHDTKALEDPVSALSAENKKTTCNQTDCHKSEIEQGKLNEKVHGIYVHIKSLSEEIREEEESKGFFSASWDFIRGKKDTPEEEERTEKDSELALKIRMLLSPRKEFRDKREHFHNVDESISVKEKDPTLCLTCHGNLPHTKAQGLRSFLNMHTFFLACETCHVNAEGQINKVDESEWIHYAWFDFTTKKRVYKLNGPAGNYNARIVPVRKETSGKEVRLDLPLREKFVKDFIEKGHNFSLEEKAKAKAIIHEKNSKEPVLCDKCHMTGGYLSLLDLNYTSKRAEQLEGPEAFDLVKKYLEYYNPSMFDQEQRLKKMRQK
jgi:hypothetical protein